MFLFQFKRESRSWKDEVGRLERKAADECEEAVDEVRKKSRIIADLSEQLKESDDRIQDLSLELDALKEKQSTDFATNNQESISKFVVSMEEKFAATLKSEKEQLELAFKERLREHEIYEKQQRLVTADVNATASSFAGQLTSVNKEALSLSVWRFWFYFINSFQHLPPGSTAGGSARGGGKKTFRGLRDRPRRKESL